MGDYVSFDVCPAHGSSDHVRKVSAVFGEQHYQGRSDHIVTAMTPQGPAVGRARGNTFIASDTARVLAPAPLGRRSALLPVFGSLPVLAIGVFFCLLQGGGAIIGVPFIVLAVCMIIYGMAVGGSNSEIKAGLSHALPIWERAWYCGRCEIVFFPAGQAPPGTGAEHSMTLKEFQRLV
jgi:hypothetical protein